jgi:hypothetical protein
MEIVAQKEPVVVFVTPSPDTAPPKLSSVLFS